MRLDVESLRVFDEVVRRNGFTAAAAVLGMAQPAVSQKVRRLEERLGVTLIRRDGHSVILTAHGRDLLAHARGIVEAHDRAVASMRRSGLAGSIRLGCNEEIAARGLAPVISAFNRTFPEVTLAVRVNDSAYVAEWLDDGEIDLALIQVIDADGGVRPGDEVWGRVELVAVQGSEADFDAADPVPFVSFAPRSVYTGPFVEQVEIAGRAVFHAMECPGIDGVQRAIEAGIGVGVLNVRYVTELMRRWHGVDLRLPAPAVVLRRRAGAEGRDELADALRDHLAAALREPNGAA